MWQKRINRRKSGKIKISKNNQFIRKGAFFKIFNLAKQIIDKIDKNESQVWMRYFLQF